MPILSFDTHTYMIRPGRSTAKMDRLNPTAQGPWHWIATELLRQGARWPMESKIAVSDWPVRPNWHGGDDIT